MSKPTLDYFTPAPRTRSRPAVAPLLLGLVACGLVAVPYVISSRHSLLSLPLAVLAAVGGICTALDAEDFDRRLMPLMRLIGLAVCNLAVIAAVVTMIVAVPLL